MLQPLQQYLPIAQPSFRPTAKETPPTAAPNQPEPADVSPTSTPVQTNGPPDMFSGDTSSSDSQSSALASAACRLGDITHAIIVLMVCLRALAYKSW